MTADVRAFVVAWVERQCGRPPKDDEHSILTLGIDSLGFLDLVAELENRFAVTIDFAGVDPQEFTTLRGLVKLVAKGQQVHS